MELKNTNLAEQMALAVIREDWQTAYALADLLIEQRNTPHTTKEKDAKELREYPPAADGYIVYQWPEFQAFCKRLGVVWNLTTIDLSIHIIEGKRVEIEQRYTGRDTSAPKRGLVNDIANES